MRLKSDILIENGLKHMYVLAVMCEKKGVDYVLDLGISLKNARMEIQTSPTRISVYYDSWEKKHFDLVLEEINNAI